jgi:O-antigen ligase
MNGQVHERFWVGMAAIFSLVVLFSPDIQISQQLPAIQLTDILLPFLIWMLIRKFSSIRFHGYYVAVGLFGFTILLSMAVNGRLLIVQDLFECYKLLKWSIVVMFFGLLPTQSYLEKWIKVGFIMLLVVNMLHYFNIANINSILTTYYNGGLHIEYFGLNSLKEPAAKRMVGLVGNPNVNALLFSLFAILLFPFSGDKNKLFWFLAAVFMVFLCQSKTSLISLCIVLLAIVILGLSELSLRMWGLLILGIGVAYFGSWVMATSGFKYPLYSNVLFEEGGGKLMKTGSAKGRLEIWKYLGKMILERPVFGYGGNKEFFYNHKLYAENEYILVAWRYGIIGLVAFLYIYIRSWLDFFRQPIRKDYAVPLLLIIAFMVTSLTNNPLSDRTISMMYAMILGIGYNQLYQKAEKSAHA